MTRSFEVNGWLDGYRWPVPAPVTVAISFTNPQGLFYNTDIGSSKKISVH